MSSDGSVTGDDEAVRTAGRGRRGPYAKSESRREEILDRAIEVFAERGVDGTSMRAIGEAVGVSHAALKHYFPSREALLVEVLRRREARLVEDVTARAGDDFTSLRLLADATVRNAAEPGFVALHTAMLATGVLDPDGEAGEHLVARYREARGRIADDLATGVMAGRPITEVADVAALLLAASDGLQAQWLLEGGTNGDVDLVRSYGLLIDLIGTRRGAQG
ncbi:TetR/AcrR family transcriptional regulator [Nocardioides bruguierae]|uniref:TetR/AcrR family transcriptional regulator n=1 Tax=Nocardioides bruguierae TaxID=2945102 RepID=A0A9X2D7U9_9ACTN|nr:TetR/AcrR family transcriptional regulator [Nocardioides bruguierae]MCM0620877.1 TetR/AcrR family transcriptional regulator [Nocardioides bruguierae]